MYLLSITVDTVVLYTSSIQVALSRGREPSCDEAILEWFDR
jgi:hypothetical protein